MLQKLSGQLDGRAAPLVVGLKLPLRPGVAVIITIMFDHPLHVALSPTHLIFDLSLSFPCEPPLQTKMRAKLMVLPLKGDLIDRPLTAIDNSFVLVQGPQDAQRDCVWLTNLMKESW